MYGWNKIALVYPHLNSPWMVQLSILFIAEEVWFWEVAFFVWYGVLPMIFPRNFTGWVDTLIVWLSANLKHRSATLDFPEKQYERHLGGGGSV